MELSNEAVLSFLDLLENEPGIWNPRTPDHKVREAVHESWRRIKRSLASRGVVSPNVSVMELKKKKDSLMARYRSLATKVKMDAGFKPTWFAYEAMAKFMDDVYKPNSPKNNGNEEDSVDPGPDLHNSNSADSLSSFTDKSPARFFQTNQGAKRIKVSNDSQITENTSNHSKEKVLTPISSSSVDKVGVNSSTDKTPNQNKVITTWSELLACKLTEFDNYTREFLMNQIDNYVFRAKVKQIKHKKEGKKKRETASAGNSQYIHPVYVEQSVQPLYVNVPSTSGVNSRQNYSQDNDQSNLSPTGSHSSLIEVKEERLDLDEDL